jgi:hypothetical protein
VVEGVDVVVVKVVVVVLVVDDVVVDGTVVDGAAAFGASLPPQPTSSTIDATAHRRRSRTGRA